MDRPHTEGRQDRLRPLLAVFPTEAQAWCAVLSL